MFCESRLLSFPWKKELTNKYYIYSYFCSVIQRTRFHILRCCAFARHPETSCRTAPKFSEPDCKDAEFFWNFQIPAVIFVKELFASERPKSPVAGANVRTFLFPPNFPAKKTIYFSGEIRREPQSPWFCETSPKERRGNYFVFPGKSEKTWRDPTRFYFIGRQKKAFRGTPFLIWFVVGITATWSLPAG